MEIGDEKSHEFTIRNDGPVPLKIKKGMTTCQCTISEVPQNQIAPGASAKVKLTWVPSAEMEQFEKGAEIKTNDPDNNPIKLKIVGTVVTRLTIFPERIWPVTDMREGSATEVAGYIATALDKDFAVTGYECESPAVSARFVDVDKSDLDRMRGVAGFKVLVSIKPEVPVGPFAFPLKLHTNLKDRKTGEPLSPTVTLSGNRRGPMRILGKDWVEDHGAVLLGTFDAAEGKKVSLTLLAKGEPEGGLKVTSITCEPEWIKAAIAPDEKSTPALPRYRLDFEYPAGGARTIRRDQNPGTVLMHTNHPLAPEIRFEVHFTAF
jgi:Protein of unknown function (DUF1573)